MALIVFIIVGGLILSRVNEEEDVQWSGSPTPRASLCARDVISKERSMSEIPEPNLALDLVRVTEAAALAPAAGWAAGTRSRPIRLR